MSSSFEAASSEPPIKAASSEPTIRAASTEPSLAIDVRDVVRTYKVKPTRPDEADTVVALAGVSLSVPDGEFIGLLGPNGAGKTTLIKILVTLLLPTSGEAFVAGFDVASQADRVRERIAMVSGGEHSGYGLLSVREQLWMFSQFYGVPPSVARARIDELLEILGLSEAGNRRVSSLSTGMRQKMNLIRGLVSDPQILFLDEPTVGLDVGAARDIRAYIQGWIQARPGRTVLLTTHYLHEAEELCDRVAIIHKGEIRALDTPSGLRRRATGSSYFVISTDPAPDESWLTRIPSVQNAETSHANGHTQIRAELVEESGIAAVVLALAEQGRKLYSLEKVEPSLEDVFVQIVGESLGSPDEPPV